MRRWRALPPALMGLVLALAGCAGSSSQDGEAARRFAEVRHSPPRLRAFLARMPKGGDLHVHLSGAGYAEGLIATGAARGLCIDPTIGAAVPPPCRPGQQPLKPATDNYGRGDYERHRAVVDGWSMRSFVATPGFSGHDQFFDSFGRFGLAADNVALAAEVVDRAGRQRMRYIELMVSFRSGEAQGFGDRIPWTGDPASFRAELLAAGLPALVPKARADLDNWEQGMRQRLGCGTPAARPGCVVEVRWQSQISRNNPPGKVAAQALLGALLQQADPRVVGINMVGPEDNSVALAGYHLHMRILADLKVALPATNIALHAGELTLGLVPPEELRFHIREAVQVAGAQRLGHAVDLMYEDDPYALLREMAERRVAVESNLTSNDIILGVRGSHAPLPIYLAAGVPVVITTDDEGVSRIDRTHELQRAVEEFNLDWPTLVALERATLEYAFLPGASLWADARAGTRAAPCAGADPSAEPPPACAAMLAESPKARLQWSLERDLAGFEAEAARLRF